eukprot:SAG25_NODE_574_length_6809_cov_44.177943_7_plen_580_part_01
MAAGARLGISSSGGGRPAARRSRADGRGAAAVSHSCACIGSPCLRHCVHGASIGGGGGGGDGLLEAQLHKAKEAAEVCCCCCCCCCCCVPDLHVCDDHALWGGVFWISNPAKRFSHRSADRSARTRTSSSRCAGLHRGAGWRGESFLRVHWVAVPKALRARRVNRQQQQQQQQSAAGMPAGLAGARQREAQILRAQRGGGASSVARAKSRFAEQQRQNEAALAALAGRDERESQLKEYTRHHAREVKREAEANRRRVLESLAEEEREQQARLQHGAGGGGGGGGGADPRSSTGGERFHRDGFHEQARAPAPAPAPDAAAAAAAAMPAGGVVADAVDTCDDILDPRERVRRKKEREREEQERRRIAELAAIRKQHREDQRAIERRRQGQLPSPETQRRQQQTQGGAYSEASEKARPPPEPQQQQQQQQQPGDMRKDAVAQAQEAEAAWRHKIQRAGGYAQDGVDLDLPASAQSLTASQFEVREGVSGAARVAASRQPELAAQVVDDGDELLQGQQGVVSSSSMMMDGSAAYDTIGVAEVDEEDRSLDRGCEFDSMCDRRHLLAAPESRAERVCPIRKPSTL